MPLAKSAGCLVSFSASGGSLKYLPLSDMYLDSESLELVSRPASDFWHRIALTADPHGCFRVSASKILAEAFPNRDRYSDITEEMIKLWLCEYQSAQMLDVWKDGSRIYARWRNWDKFNKSHGRYSWRIKPPENAPQIRLDHLWSIPAGSIHLSQSQSDLVRLSPTQSAPDQGALIVPQEVTEDPANLVNLSPTQSEMCTSDSYSDTYSDTNTPAQTGNLRMKMSDPRKEKKGKRTREKHDYESDHDFVKFWDAYPAPDGVFKRGKSRAFEEWKALSLEDRGKVLEAIAWQLKTKAYIPSPEHTVLYPERYLKYRRFDDEKPSQEKARASPSKSRCTTCNHPASLHDETTGICKLDFCDCVGLIQGVSG
jgi:hypothetical protein